MSRGIDVDAEVRRMIAGGKTDEEIRPLLVAVGMRDYEADSLIAHLRDPSVEYNPL